MNNLNGNEGYYKRIGAAKPAIADLEALKRVHRAHLESIPFENFDILMGRLVSIETEAIRRKLVENSRGGYCFETNSLLCEMLKETGFTARPLLGRVVFGGPDWVPPRMHAIVLVELDGKRYLVDAGFGAHTPRAPMLIEDGAEMADAGRTWRLSVDPVHGWRLTDRHGEAWRDLYVFDLDVVYPADYKVMNHWCATSTDSPFVGNALIVRHTGDGRVTLLGRQFARYHGTLNRDGRVLESVDDLKKVLAEDFHLSIEATDAEWDMIWQRMPVPETAMDW